MGAAQSSTYISPEAAATALVLAGAVALGYTQLSSSSALASASTSDKKKAKTTAQSDPSDTPDASASKKGKKKGKSTAPVATSTGGSTLVPGAPDAPSFADVAKLPGGFDDGAGASASEKKKKKGKAKAKGGKDAEGTVAGVEVLDPQSVSASIDFLSASEIQPAATPPAAGKKSKKGKGAASTPAASQTLPTPSAVPTQTGKAGKTITPSSSSKPTPKGTPAPAPESPKLSRPTPSTTSLDTDGSWTRVSARKSKAKAPVGGADSTGTGGETPSGTAESSPVISMGAAGPARSSARELEEESSVSESDSEEEAQPGEAREFLLSAAARASAGGERRTLAERLLPKPRKTAVDDMLTTPDHPTLSRVMRVTPLPNEKPAQGFSWGDYEDVGDDGEGEGEWGVVQSKKSKRPLSASAPGLGSTPSAAPKAPKASETLTKKQRQNRKTAELKKAAKADQASVQQSAFDAHRRELERERMKAQASAGKGKGKVSGGMVASVDEGGKLVWD